MTYLMVNESLYKGELYKACCLEAETSVESKDSTIFIVSET